MAKVKASSFMIVIPFLNDRVLPSAKPVDLKGQHWVNCSLPKLATKNKLTKKEGWEILEANLEALSAKINLLEASDLGSRNQAVVLRSQVQDWHRANVNNFSKLGLNVIKNHKPKASADDPVYRQLVCIALLDELFSRKVYIQKEIDRGHEKTEKPPWRRQLCWWWLDFKNKYL